MYFLFLSLWPRLSLWCILNIRQLEFHRITILTRFVLFVVRGGLVFLFFAAPSFAVFVGASKFNSDLSNWNTGKVTEMNKSKCTLSLFLPVATPFAVVLFYIRQLEVHRITIHTFFFFLLILNQSVQEKWLHTNTLRWQMAILTRR